jgi:hypothetical protein
MVEDVFLEQGNPTIIVEGVDFSAEKWTLLNAWFITV